MCHVSASAVAKMKFKETETRVRRSAIVGSAAW